MLKMSKMCKSCVYNVYNFYTQLTFCNLLDVVEGCQRLKHKKRRKIMKMNNFCSRSIIFTTIFWLTENVYKKIKFHLRTISLYCTIFLFINIFIPYQNNQNFYARNSSCMLQALNTQGIEKTTKFFFAKNIFLPSNE